MLIVRQIINSPISSNCFVLYDEAIGEDCLIVDPGSCNNHELYQFIEEKRLTPLFIILTHEHFDHCWGVNGIREKYPEIKLLCSSSCSVAIQNKKKNYSVYNEQPGFELKPADIEVENINWSLGWNNYKIQFHPAKGHTTSGIIVVVNKYLFTGDELIKGIKTVTKLKTGSNDALLESLKFLKSLQGQSLIVCPGHGDMFELDGYNLGLAIKSDL